MFHFIVPIILSASYVQPVTNLPCEPRLTIAETSSGITWKEESLGAYYSISQQKIYICPQVLSDKEQTKQVYLHEYGHHLYFTKLTEEQKKEWSKISKSEGYVSEYAKKNDLEDFAETFGYILRKQSGIPENKSLFIKNLLGNTILRK